MEADLLDAASIDFYLPRARPLMKTLPAVAYDLSPWHRTIVHRNCRVQFVRTFCSATFTLTT